MFKRILVCLDGSDLAEQVLPYVIEQAKHFNSRVILFEVVTGEHDVVIPTTPTGDPMPQASHVSAELVEREARKDEAYLERVAKRLREKHLHVEVVSVLDALIGQAIVDYAHENGIDLICLSTHGRSGISRSLFGSVADHVVRESHLPILLLRPRDN